LWVPEHIGYPRRFSMVWSILEGPNPALSFGNGIVCALWFQGQHVRYRMKTISF
jgi:hypothetical protein